MEGGHLVSVVRWPFFDVIENVDPYGHGAFLQFQPQLPFALDFFPACCAFIVGVPSVLCRLGQVPHYADLFGQARCPLHVNEADRVLYISCSSGDVGGQSTFAARRGYGQWRQPIVRYHAEATALGFHAAIRQEWIREVLQASREQSRSECVDNRRFQAWPLIH